MPTNNPLVWRKSNKKYYLKNQEALKTKARSRIKKLRIYATFRRKHNVKLMLQARKRRAKRMQIIWKAKDKPCVDCGIKLPPEVMDLDHVRCKKRGPIGGSSHYFSWDQLAEEIAKCDVRCPNCHRLRHYRENIQNLDLNVPAMILYIHIRRPGTSDRESKSQLEHSGRESSENPQQEVPHVRK